MTTFAYTAISLSNAASGSVNGRRDAVDERALREALRQDGLIAVDVRPVSPVDALRARMSRDRARRSDTVWFFQTLRLMLANKVPIESAVTTMRDLAPSPRLRRMCDEVREVLRGGSPLSEAVRRVKGLADAQAIALLTSGQESGRLDHAVELIDQSIATAQRTRRLITGRLMYPAMLLVAAALAVWFLSAFVIPKFAATLEALGGQIPWQTSLTLTVARYAVWVVPPVVVGLVVAWMTRESWLGPRGRRRLSAVALRTPVLGSLLWHGYAGTLTDVLATMLEGGGEVLAGLEQAQKVVSSPIIAERVARAREAVRGGVDVGEALHNETVLPPMVGAIVRAGIKGGDLVGALRRAGAVCRETQDAISSRLLTFMEPAVIALLSAVVGWVVYSLVTGMLAMNEAASG